mmetsp:Transcript_4127/g.7934  ORF Transcript_4127/g.7934 Transcript_4127/m.7934 type:complete len:129 (-) Transcript_4127:821-1207(-)
MSSDLMWQLVRRNHCFLKKRGQSKVSFSTEPGNLMGLHRATYSGLSGVKGVDIAVGDEGMGPVLSLKSEKEEDRRKPSSRFTRTQLENGEQVALKAAKELVKSYPPKMQRRALARVAVLVKASERTSE